MSLPKTEKIWHNGKFIDWDDAKIHVLSHVVSYGSAVFEGIRCYNTAQGPAIFRLRDHTQRLINSAHIYRMEIPFTLEELFQAQLELVRVNKLNACYLRPIVLRGYGDAGVDPGSAPIEVYLACWEWGKYLGEDGVRNGVDVCVSSWNRFAPNTLPQMSKAAANYMSSQLIRMEAKANGYTEGIALDPGGHVVGRILAEKPVQYFDDQRLIRRVPIHLFVQNDLLAAFLSHQQILQFFAIRCIGVEVGGAAVLDRTSQWVGTKASALRRCLPSCRRLHQFDNRLIAEPREI